MFLAVIPDVYHQDDAFVRPSNTDALTTSAKQNMLRAARNVLAVVVLSITVVAVTLASERFEVDLDLDLPSHLLAMASSNKCLATNNKCHTSSNKKPLELN